jgi:hypothetical protein
MMSRDITWLITMGAIMGIRKFTLQMSEVRKRENIGLNESLIYTNSCSPLSNNLFYLPPLHLSSQKKELFFGRNIFGGAFSPPLHPPSTPNYADANGDTKAGSPLFLYHLKM